MKFDLINDDLFKLTDNGCVIDTCLRGSILYGTQRNESDTDMLIIVKDNVEFVNVQNDPRGDNRIVSYSEKTLSHILDVQIVHYSDFLDLLAEHNPLAVEGVFEEHSRLKDLFVLDKWKLRQAFGKVASNSYVKAKKKMTVEKDLDIMCGLKSLFHSIRLLKFACCLAETGTIDFHCATQYWVKMYETYNNKMRVHCTGTELWECLDKEWKKVYNEIHSQMVLLCPRPETEK